MNNCFHKLKKDYISYIIICLGIYFRINQYLQNRSLWLDECFFAYSVFNNELLNNLQFQKYHQCSPIGFIFIEKIITLLIDHSEYSLRLFPLVCGIASILFFYKLLNYFYKGIAVYIPLLLFCFSRQLVYYSSEAKQYSSDVLFTIILIILGLKLQQSNTSKRTKVLIMLLSFISVFFSLTSVFTLAAITIFFLLRYLYQKESTNKTENIIFSLGWIISSLVYLISKEELYLKNTYLHQYWQNGYITENASAINIFRDAFYFIGFRNFNLDFSVFVIGLIAIVVRRKIIGVYLSTPFFLLTICSFLKLYPATGRLILFITPIIYLIIAESISFIISSRFKFIKIWGYCLVLFFTLSPTLLFITEINSPLMRREDIKKCLEYINKEKRLDDIVYLQHFSQYCFKYYAKDFKFNDDFTPPENWSDKSFKKDFYKYKRWYVKDGYNKLFISKVSRYTTMNRRKIDYELKLLKGYPRVWILISHDSTYYANRLKKHFNKYGKEIDRLIVPGSEMAESHLYLYDFSTGRINNKKRENRFKSFFQKIFKRKNK